MDECVVRVAEEHVPHFDRLRKEGKHAKTPNIEEVVYFPVREAQDRVVRGTRTHTGSWYYEYVPGIGY